jgi:hypothetical protein
MNQNKITRELLYQYELTCLTEGKNYEIWNQADDVPVECPIHKNHIIDSNNIKILSKAYDDYLDLQRIVIEETTEDIVQGFFRVEMHKFSCPSNEETSYRFTYPYPISILVVKIITKEENDKDIVKCNGLIDTPIGIVLSNVDKGDTEIKVSSTVIKYLSRGAACSITNFVNTDILGEVTCLYSDRIAITNSPINSYSSNMSYIKLYAENIKDLILHKEIPLLSLGDSKIGGSMIKPGVILEVLYNNLSSNIDKEFSFIIEYNY